MSRVYFTSRDGGAELRGWERAWCGSAVEHVAYGLLHISGNNDPVWDFLGVPKDEWPRTLPGPEGGASLLSISHRDKPIEIDGNSATLWEMTLNTAWIVGNEPLQLMAAIHAQCEIHGWVDGPDRKWLADIMRRGRATNLYRPHSGWEEVIDFLESSDASEVVTSYSVTESFPDLSLIMRMGVWAPTHLPSHTGWGADGNTVTPLSAEDCYRCPDTFYDLPDDEKWRLGIEALRAAGDGLQWEPSTWADRWFGSGERLTVMDLRRAAQIPAELAPDSSYGPIWSGRDRVKA